MAPTAGQLVIVAAAQERAKLDIAEARRAAAEQAKQPKVNKGD